jgi:transcriptional regulator with XRE-family HTH domain
LKYYNSCNIIVMEIRAMATSWLRAVRQQKGWTQRGAAAKLGVSQPYLSLLEQGHRPLTTHLLSKLQRHFDVPTTELPVEAPGRKVTAGAQQLAEALGALGYPGFAYLRHGARWHPARVLLTALQQPNLEARLAEALPWVVLRYPKLNWDWVFERAKVKDLQNRLGFVLSLTRQLAERLGDHAMALKLAGLGQQLNRARLAEEDTLGRESMTAAERRWLRDARSPEAKHWNLLTDLVPEHLPYAS